jgi:hypothetical protein
MPASSFATRNYKKFGDSMIQPVNTTKLIQFEKHHRQNSEIPCLFYPRNFYFLAYLQRSGHRTNQINPEK